MHTGVHINITAGLYINSLKDSKMANQIGFNGRELKYFTVNNSHIEVDHNDIKNSIFASTEILLKAESLRFYFITKLRKKMKSAVM